MTASPRVLVPIDHPAQALAHIFQAARQRQDGHDLARHGDVEAGPAGLALLLRAEAHLDLPQEAVVRIDDPPPGDGSGIDIQAGKAGPLLPGSARPDRSCEMPSFSSRRSMEAENRRLPSRSGGQRASNSLTSSWPHSWNMRASMAAAEQVVGGGDGVDVAGEMQVELVHRHDLGVAAAGRPALDAERGSLGGLADAGEDALAQVDTQRLAEPDGGGGLALSQRSGRDGGHVDVFAVRAVLQPLEDLQLDLGLIRAVKLDLLGQDAALLRHPQDAFEGGRLGDIHIAGDRTDEFQRGCHKRSGHSGHSFSLVGFIYGPIV